MNYESILSNRIQEIKPSGIRKFFDIVSEMKDAISLGVGEPDFTTPWRYSDAAIYSLRAGHTHYTSNRGLKELTKLISEYEARFGVKYDPNAEIMVTVGASEGIDLAMRACINPGEEVIIPQPAFVCYGPIASLAGGVPVIISTKEENRKISAELKLK